MTSLDFKFVKPCYDLIKIKSVLKTVSVLCPKVVIQNMLELSCNKFKICLPANIFIKNILLNFYMNLLTLAFL